MTERKHTFNTNLRRLMRQKAARDDRKVTQKVVAREIGMGQATISRWTSGNLHEIDADTLLKLAEYFDCGINDVIESVE